MSSPRKWSPPRKNNSRAWKRIAKGEWLWDRRRVRRVKVKPGKYPAEVEHAQYEITTEPCPEDCHRAVCTFFGHAHQGQKRRVKIAGTERMVDNYRAKPTVDMGG